MSQPTEGSAPVPSSKDRQYYIDWLRVFAVLMLVPFHTAMIFVRWDFHIKNGTLSDGLTDFNSFLGMWHMPLLFFLSGASSWFALGHRNVGQYVKERFRRLFIPLAFGILVIVPPQTYLERLQKGQFQGSYPSFYPEIFNGVYPEGNFTWNHLWFLAYLFVFSMLAVRLFVYFRTAKGRETVARMAAFFERPGRMLLLAVPLMLMEAGLHVKWPGPQNFVTDWANFLFSITVFVYGFVLCSHERFIAAVVRQRGLFLAIGLAFPLFLKTLAWIGASPQWGYNPWNMICLALSAVNTWCWVLAFLGFGKTYLNRTNNFLQYAAEAALPFYILHQTVIIIIGFQVVQWDMGIMAKFAFINLSSLVAIVAVYDVLVRRIGVLRFLFGMRPFRRPVDASAGARA